MLKIMLTGFMLPLLLLLGPPESSPGNSVSHKQKSSGNPPEAGTGTLQKMIVENGSVTMDLDLNRLNGTGAMTGKLETVRFAVAANSFFSILVFNDLLRGPEQGSMALIPQNSTTLPAALSAAFNQLTVEKLPSTQQFDLAVRDAKTGFVFFNIQGHQYDYDANAQLLSLNGGRLVISREFANALGRPSEAGSEAGKFPSERQCSRSKLRSWWTAHPYRSLCRPCVVQPARKRQHRRRARRHCWGHRERGTARCCRWSPDRPRSGNRLL